MNEQSNYVNVGKMTECGHCHPEKFQAVEPCDCICHEQKQSWEERLEELNKRLGLGNVGLFEVKQFISQEIQKAREEEKERIIGIIKENYKGAFTDDGGNNCWYVDELIKIINK